MRRYLLAAAVVAADTTLLVAGHRGTPPWSIAGYALAAALIIALTSRVPKVAFVAVLALFSLTGGAFALLMWTAYRAGRAFMSRSDCAVVVGAALGGLAVQLAVHAADSRAATSAVSVYAVFVALPLLVARYLAQHERLITALDQRNRQLRRERDLLAERERLHERLRIARDMHDSLGHRLSLVSIQAAALEVSSPTPEQRRAIRQLAGATRDALNELYELVGALRTEEEPREPSPGMGDIGRLVRDFEASGVPVELRRSGEPGTLPSTAGQAAYRVIEEGLTNATKHAPGQPVTVTIAWEPDALLLTVTNPIPERPAASEARGAGHGLSGLGERIGAVGGFVDHRLSDEEFRLFAMLPAVDGGTDDSHGRPAVGRLRAVAVGFAAAALMFVVLPAGMLLGAR